MDFVNDDECDGGVAKDPTIEALARATGFSTAAIGSMRGSIERGGGRMAQFDHPEFGGPGQWMRGGMLMIGDFANDDLKRRVGALCDALADPVDRGEAAPARSATTAVDHATQDGAWYPASLGRPETSGAQDAMRYAWFRESRRLAIDDGHRVTIRDTGDHRIAGVAQQQGRGTSLTFTSQHGPLDVERLPIVEDRPGTASAVLPAARGVSQGSDPTVPTRGTTDPFVALEKLADLHARGIVDHDAFEAKKAELLKRI